VAPAVRSQTAHGTEVVIDLGGSDPDGDALTLSRLDPPGHGTVEAVDGLTVRYRPEAGFAGTDRFGYELTDALGARTEGSVEVEVAPDQPPTALRPLAVRTGAGTTVTIDPREAAEDADGGPVHVLATSQPLFGTVVHADDDTLQYRAAAGFWGRDRFSYQVGGPDGSTLTGTVEVDVDLDDTAPQVLVSSSPDRSGAVSLTGGALTGPVAIFVEPAAAIATVRFYLDDPGRLGSPLQTEVEAPFDLGRTDNATGLAHLFDPALLAPGEHDLTVTVTFLDGREAVVNVAITRPDELPVEPALPPAADIASA
jgi:hypothetical protein